MKEKKDIKELYPEFDNELIEELASIKGVSAYHSLSFKAMHIINKEMLTTEMNQIQVLHKIEMFDKNRKSLRVRKILNLMKKLFYLQLLKERIEKHLKSLMH